MRIVGHKSEKMWKRYNAIDEKDLTRAASRLNTYLEANTLITPANLSVSYQFCKCLILWSRRVESNHRPAVYETAALPTELRRPGEVRRNLTQGMEALSMIETLLRHSVDRNRG